MSEDDKWSSSYFKSKIAFFLFIYLLQITSLEFECVWILHLKISEFGFYPLKFKSI